MENLELKNKNSKDRLSISMENTKKKDPVSLTQNSGNYLNWITEKLDKNKTKANKNNNENRASGNFEMGPS